MSEYKKKYIDRRPPDDIYKKKYADWGGRDDIYEKDWGTLEGERREKLERERRNIKKDAKTTAKAAVSGKGGKVDGMGQIKSIGSCMTQKGEEGKLFRKEVSKQAGKEVAKKATKEVAKKAVQAVGKFLVSTIGVWGPILLILVFVIFCVMAVIYYVCEGGGFGAAVIGRLTGLRSMCSM